MGVVPSADHPDAARVPLDAGRFALVDMDDLDVVMQYHWTVNTMRTRIQYAVARPRHNGINEAVSMHRQILALDDGSGDVGHHVNGDGLDNRRENLWRMTDSEHKRMHSTEQGRVSHG